MQLTLYDKNGREKVRFSPSDSSTQTKEIQGDNVLGLSFTLYEFVAIDVNDYIDYEGERYRALEKYAPAEKSTVEWEYSVQFYGVESLIKRFLVLNNTDGDNEAVFTLTDKPSVHLALIVRCINEGMASMGTARWVAGAIANDLNAENVVIDYHGKYCDEALRELAEAVGSEWYIEGTTVSIGRCEFGEPLTLGYGEGKGLTSLDRDRADNAKFYTRLFPIGSSRNIDPSDYGHARLQLPGGAKFVDVNTDEYGIIHHYEQEAFAGIYPRRIGEVASVRSVQATSDDGTPYTIYYFKDNGLDFNPDEYMMAGKVLRVSFQDGEMAGLGESDDHYFEVNWHNDTREFEIITIWPYGNDIQLPGGNLIPKRGDHYILWNCRMPREYYGYAEAEFLDAVNAYNADHALDVSRYKGPTDHVWVERKEAEAGAQHAGLVLYLGRRVRLESSEYFPDTGHRLSRITKITRKVTLPSQMDLEISNALSRTSLEKIGDDIGEARNYAATLFRGITAPDLIRVGDRTPPTDNNLYSARRSHEEFASKKTDDTFAGLMGFLQGFTVGTAQDLWGYVRKVTENGVEKVASWFKNLATDILTVTGSIKGGRSGILSIDDDVDVWGDIHTWGGVLAEHDVSAGRDVVAGDTVRGKDGSFSGTVTTQNLKVTGSAYFWQLVIDKIRSAGGSWLITSADGFKVEKVEQQPNGNYRLLWKAKDKDTGKATRSMWKSGMQAVCREMNAAEGVNYNLSNKYYWALVTATGTSPIDEEDYHWIELSATENDGVLSPEVGDELAQLGYRGNDDPQAQAALYLAAYQSIDNGVTAPVFAIYEGIDDFHLESHRVSTISPSLVEFLASKLRIRTGANSSTDIATYINDSVSNAVSHIDVADGVDGVTVGITPSEVIITESYDPERDTMDYDVRNNAELATVWARQGVANCAVSIEQLTFDSSALSLSIGSGNIRIVLNDSAQLGYGTWRKQSVLVRVAVTYVKKAATASSQPVMATERMNLTLTIYVNRLGQVRYETIGDVTTVVRSRIIAEQGAGGLLSEYALKSEVRDAADGFSRQISSLPISRNLLLNSDFAAMAETDNGCIHLVPTTFWQGYQQESRNAQGEWVNRLVGGAAYTLSFYARGKGRVGAIVHHTLLTGDTSQGNQASMLETLTSKPKLYTIQFTPSVDCPFRVMLGSNSYPQGEMPGTEIYISRPKLVRNSASTTNLLTNPNLGNVADGIPQGWTLWDNWESGSAAPVEIREIVPELYPPSTPVAWEKWTNGDTGLSPTLTVDSLENGTYPINIVPRSYWNGLAQRSYVREGADGWDGSAKVLKHDTWYTLSFEAKGARSGVRAGFIIDCVNLVRASDKFGRTVGGTAFEWDLTTNWKRYTYKFKAQANYDTSATDTDGYGFSLMLGLVNAISGTYTQNVIQIRRPQLEEGETATEWRRGEESGEMMATRFVQTEKKFEFTVQEGKEVGGMLITKNGVRLKGALTTIEGDLDLQGLTTENVKIVGRDPFHPTVVNMGIGASNENETIKSVLVKGNITNNDIHNPVYGTHMVVLPFYDSKSSLWRGNTGITFSSGDGTFYLHNDASTPNWKRKIVQWKKGGTRLTVTNEHIFKYRNWQNANSALFANSLGGFVVVCADARVVCEDNLGQEYAPSGKRFNPSEGPGQISDIVMPGCFSCGGYLARFIVLLPGQTLQLRSQIVTDNDREILTWVVENPMEFVPYTWYDGNGWNVHKMRFRNDSQYDDESLVFEAGIASYNDVESLHGSYETFLVPPAMLKRDNGIDDDISFLGLYGT